ncbi:MAG: M64 family metallopeptidase, partial [Deltaproteobacteria bacterium]|nr:M64 family metallopeptidase [Deltaproteobacteria bacterium]
DILFVSAGYTEDELGDFHALRETMADDFLALPDFAEYLDRFNFWYIERPSETSGFGGDNPEYLYDASNNRWYADEGFTADMHEIGERVPAQVIVAIANEDGGRPNVATRGGRQIMSLYPDWESHGLLAHELGHAHFNLGDEYSERACNRATIESKAERWDNLTDDPGNSGWEHLTTLNYCPIWDFEQYPVIGYDYEQYRDEVSHFIGGGACDVVDSEATLWRGSLSCRMSKNWEHTMCPVCRDSIRKVFQEYSEDSSCPSSWDGDGICDRCLGDDSDCCRFSFNIRDLLGSGTEYLQCLVDSVCGNQVCEAVYGEDTETCPSDCYGAAFCGDGDCNYDETDENCPQDCGCAAADWGPDRCGAQVAAFGCGCDAECIDAGDCCADACSTCGECEELDERPSGPR